MKKHVLPTLTLEPMGVIRTCYPDRFGIPRQPGMAARAPGVIKLKADAHYNRAVEGLDGFSHLWIVFWFHEHGAKAWKPSVRPPRLGGAKRTGVLATRSPHRPNPLGLSAVRLHRIDLVPRDGIEIHVSGVDLLDKTPILDLKPYIAYADAIPDTRTGWASEQIKEHPVDWSATAREAVAQIVAGPAARELLYGIVEDTLKWDPRPAYQIGKKGGFGFRLRFEGQDLDVKWKPSPEDEARFEVTDVVVWRGPPPKRS